MYGGLASDGIELYNGVQVAALVVVNALGDVINPKTGAIIAGALNPSGKGFLDTVAYMKRGEFSAPIRGTNTTLAIVATNAQLDKEMITKVAQMAQNGIARAIRPAHTMYDGDIVFALSVGNRKADVNVVGEAAAEVVSQAIVRAVELGNDLKR